MSKQAVLVVFLSCILAVVALFSPGSEITSSAAPPVPLGFEDVPIAAVAVPTALAFTSDGRLLITNQVGQLWIYQNGALVPTPGLQMGGQVCTNSERGLLGIAVDPAFTPLTNNFIYAYYTFNNAGTCVNRVSRFTLAADNTVNPASELVLIDNIHSTAGNHNGGDIHFGKDGLLYISVGDGGCDYAGDSGCAGANDAARDRHVLVGKILRINRDGTIPASNPFQGADSGRCNVNGFTTTGNWCQEIFATGLRNPFRIAFDPNAAGTRFFINDVGQSTWEEIDEGIAGADYGWNVREGHSANGSTTDCGPPPAGITNPIFDYPRNCAPGVVSGNSITGGAFVPAGVWPPAYNGSYLFGEFICGKIYRLAPDGLGGLTASEFATDLGGGPVALIFGPYQSTQALYYTSFVGGGQIHRIRSLAPTAAGASISGRVTGSGYGLRGVQLTLSNISTGETRTAVSATFGYYRFDDVPVGVLYSLTVSAKRYSFDPDTQINLVDELTDVDFNALPLK